jgi:hypothetical protein
MCASQASVVLPTPYINLISKCLCLGFTRGIATWRKDFELTAITSFSLLILINQPVPMHGLALFLLLDVLFNFASCIVIRFLLFLQGGL